MTILETNAVAVQLGMLLIPALVIEGILVRAAWRLRGTTLVAPIVWGMVAVGAVSGVELAAIGAGEESAQGWLAAARFIAAVSTLCPAIALLGAKRPQSRAWQFIVLTLLGILAQPAIVGLLLHYGEPVTLHAARQWFLGVLMLIGVVNYLPTRNAISGVFICVAQILLLWGRLPGMEIDDYSIAGGARAWSALLLTTWACVPPLAPWPRPLAGKSPWDRLWVDFRNAYGIVWSLRIEERLNASLAAAGEPTRLGWNGFEIAPAKKEPAIERQQPDDSSQSVAAVADPPELAARPALVALLRRFVSKEWIAARLHT